MKFDPELLAIIFGFAVLSNRLIAALVTPLFDKYSWDKFPLMYIAWVVAGVLVFASGINLFSAIIPSAIIGQLFTAVVAGGGGNILHDIADQQSTVLFISEGNKSDLPKEMPE